MVSCAVLGISTAGKRTPPSAVSPAALPLPPPCGLVMEDDEAALPAPSRLPGTEEETVEG